MWCMGISTSRDGLLVSLFLRIMAWSVESRTCGYSRVFRLYITQRSLLTMNYLSFKHSSLSMNCNQNYLPSYRITPLLKMRNSRLRS